LNFMLSRHRKHWRVERGSKEVAHILAEATPLRKVWSGADARTTTSRDTLEAR